MSLALVILPEFLLILLGALFQRTMHWGEGFWQGLEKLVYFVLFPALLFVSIVRVPFAPSAGRFLCVGAAVTLCGALAGYAAKLLIHSDRLNFASGVQCAFRFNSFLALAPATKLGGDAGLALLSLLIGIAVPICNLISVWGLARTQDTGVLRELARNPLIVATLSGLLCNLAGLHLPLLADAVLHRLGQASVPLGLLAVGAGLRWVGAREAPLLATWFIAVKLLLLPMLALVFTRFTGLSVLQTQIVVMFAALPSASSSYILAMRMGGNGPLVAFIVSAATITSLGTLPFWLMQVVRT